MGISDLNTKPAVDDGPDTDLAGTNDLNIVFVDAPDVDLDDLRDDVSDLESSVVDIERKVEQYRDALVLSLEAQRRLVAIVEGQHQDIKSLTRQLHEQVGVVSSLFLRVIDLERSTWQRIKDRVIERLQ